MSEANMRIYLMTMRGVTNGSREKGKNSKT